MKRVKLLLDKYNWILECESPLNVRTKDGKHYAQNFAAELVIKYYEELDLYGSPDEKEDAMNLYKPIS